MEQTTDARHDPESSQPATTRPKRFRWRLGLAILLLGTVAAVVAWVAAADDRTRQMVFSGAAVSLTVLALLIWWFFLSGVRWWVRIVGALGAVLLVGAARLAVRVESYTGELLPIFSLRWRPTPEERARDYWQARPAAASSGGSELTTERDVPALEMADTDWPGFCGVNRDGVVRGATIRSNWDAVPPRQIWRHPVGLGYSSFAVAGGLAFTQEQRFESEVVVCYDFQTGKEVWAHGDSARFSETMGGDGPRATPTVFDSHVYALGATGILNCLVARTGALVWSTNILEDAGTGNVEWGMSGSPLVDDDVVVVTPGGNGHAVVAYDRQRGTKLWHGGDRRTGYSSPQLTSIGGLRQILVFGGDGLAGHELGTGRELWAFDWPNNLQINVAQPVVIGEEAILIGAGYGKGSALLNVVIQGDHWAAETAPRWTSKQLKLKLNNAVARDGYVYGLDEGILTCLAVSDGKRQWKGGRYGYGQLLLVEDLLLMQAESGDVALVEATPERHRETARFQAIQGKTWNHPVLVRGRLLVRNAEEAACYDLSD